MKHTTNSLFTLIKEARDIAAYHGLSKEIAFCILCGLAKQQNYALNLTKAKTIISHDEDILF